jgi:6-methylsalicylate decarboxylase
MTGWLDVHAHYLTPHYTEQCRAAGHQAPDGMPGLPGWSAESATEVMAASGVAAAVLSISSPGVHFGDESLVRNQAARDLARHVNDEGARLVARSPARFGLSASLPLPDVDGALAEISYVYDELGADAITLHTNHHGRYLTDPAFDPVLAELDRRAAVVTLHPTSPPGWERTALGRPRPMLEFLFDTTRCVVDLILSGTLDRYPRIRWIVPHAGAVLPSVAHRVAGMSVLTGSPVDVPAALGGLYYDLAGLPLPVALDALLAVAGPERLLYGSDFPFTPAPFVTELAAAIRRAPALRTARLTPGEGSPGAALFPRLATDTRTGTEPQQESP